MSQGGNTTCGHGGGRSPGRGIPFGGRTGLQGGKAVRTECRGTSREAGAPGRYRVARASGKKTGADSTHRSPE